MKTLRLLLLALVCASPLYAETNACDGCVNPGQATAVGGKGVDGKFHEAATNNAGQFVVAPSGTPMPVSGTVTNQPSGTPMPITATTPIPVTSTLKQSTGTPSSYAILTADGTVFTLAAGEIGFIQNLSTDAPLAVKYGASASTTSFNFILPVGVVASDGKGGAYRIDNWVGAVSVAKITGTASYVAWKYAP